MRKEDRRDTPIYVCVYACILFIHIHTQSLYLLHEPQLLALGLVDAHADVEVLLQPVCLGGWGEGGWVSGGMEWSAAIPTNRL